MDPDSLDEADDQQVGEPAEVANDESVDAHVEEPIEEVDLDAMASDLDAVDHALRRLDDGTYGSCEVCQEPIADEVLAADPVVRRCAAHVGGAPAPIDVA